MDMKLKSILYVAASFVMAQVASASIAEQAVRTKAAGIDIIAYPMGVKDVITVTGSLPAGDAYAKEGNLAAPTLVGMLLDKGTTKQDKFSIAKQLDDVGAQLGFGVGQQTVTVQARFLKKDLPLVMRLMAEQLRTPAFSGEEIAKAKTQLEAALRQAQTNVDARAREAFARAIYPPEHPNRPLDSKEMLEATSKLTVEDLRSFHKKYYGPAHMRLVFVGDISAPAIRKEVAKAFAGWSGGVDVERSLQPRAEQPSSTQTIVLADKASVSVMFGQPTGLRYADADSLALRVGTAILGSGFTGRLMGTVRDKEGLTYGISANVDEDTFVDGSWVINAAFAPALLEKGIAATRRELQVWWEKGVTADELAARKTNLIGAFQVGLATTRGMAGAIQLTLDRGKNLSWLDELPKAIDALTVEQVNSAIRKYVDPQKLVLVEAGTLP